MCYQRKKLGGMMCVHALVPVSSGGHLQQNWLIRSSPLHLLFYPEINTKYTSLCIPCHRELIQVLKSFLSAYDKGLEGLRLFVF